MNYQMMIELREGLLNAYLKTDMNEQLSVVLESVRRATGATIASIWSVNQDFFIEKEKTVSLSLIKRSIPKIDSNILKDLPTYIQDPANSFFFDSLDSSTCESPFYVYELSQATLLDEYKELSKIDIHQIVCVPIHSNNSVNRNLAIVVLCFNSKYSSAEFSEIAAFLDHNVSFLWDKSIKIKKQSLITSLFDQKDALFHNDTLKPFFDWVLSNLFPRQCKYQVASAYIWNAFDNRYILVSSLGLDYSKKDCFYWDSCEDGFGHIALTDKITIYNYLEDEKKKLDNEDNCSILPKSEAKAMMVIPLLGDSRTNSIIGVIRLLNKVDEEHGSDVCFNDLDAEVLGEVSKHLSLFLNSYLNDENTRYLISHLSHDLKANVASISKTAQLLLNRYDSNDMVEFNRNLPKYLEDILYYSSFLKWEIQTNLHVSSIGSRKKPLCNLYNIQSIQLYDLLCQSKSLVKPVANQDGVSIDNIKIGTDIPSVLLYVDVIAFNTVFYNLLTNAIHYRDFNRAFYIGISSIETTNGIDVYIEDYGIGIEPQNKEKIFQMGYRGENASRTYMHGFGIGLPVVKQILMDFYSSIEVYSFSNPTCFKITLSNKLKDNNYTFSEQWTR